MCLSCLVRVMYGRLIMHYNHLAERYQSLQRKLQGKISFLEPMSRHTSLRVGGPAECFVEPCHLQDIQAIYTFAQAENIPVTVIGAGTNLLVSDRGIAGIVLQCKSGFTGYRLDEQLLTIQSGWLLPDLIRLSHRYGLTGTGFLAGIPGSVGGAVYMNAGTSHHFFSDILHSGLLWDPVNLCLHQWNREDFQFGYRFSQIQHQPMILLEATLLLTKGDIQAEMVSIREQNTKRRQTQPLHFPNAGCTWKNPGKESAGYLIEASGLKGRTIGKAMISSVHSNFIVNLGGATCQDILTLMEEVEKTVFERYNIQLVRELQMIV